MHDFQLERGDMDSGSVHVVIQVFIFFQAPLQSQQLKTQDKSSLSVFNENLLSAFYSSFLEK